ncbi:MAG: sigma-54-dependent Fis family transcriptional regulator [Candidatus Sumerlaeia bacterium]|nr:sigma-54-dependent Fis family transcriptional regulator [Candidatus Sumerlaeia bacterium]
MSDQPTTREANGASILVVDDRPEMTEMLARFLRRRGHTVEAVNSADEALAFARGHRPDLVLTDVRMPGMSGLDLLRALNEEPDPPQVIVMTAFGTVETAVEAMRLGAFHYILKPFNLGEVKVVIEKALERRKLEREVRDLREQVEQRTEFRGILARSKRMHEIFDLIRRVAPTSTTVLITGASGTGKELVARALHHHSLRRERPFVSVNCTALPETLLESELFGHARGAFTGAIMDKRGLFEEGDSGTVFLDEIGEISPLLQQRLLRVLQEREFFRVGESTPRTVDVRIITATNRDLQTEVKAGRFREDLYYRLNVVNIHLPELRERREDIPMLVDHFIQKACRVNRLREKTIAPETLKKLVAHEWPGNVRELENVIERAAVLSRDTLITDEDLPPEIIMNVLLQQSLPTKFLADAVNDRLTLDELEKRYILALLDALHGSKSETAKVLGIDRKTLYRRLLQYGVAAEGN